MNPLQKKRFIYRSFNTRNVYDVKSGQNPRKFENRIFFLDQKSIFLWSMEGDIIEKKRDIFDNVIWFFASLVPVPR